MVAPDLEDLRDGHEWADDSYRVDRVVQYSSEPTRRAVFLYPFPEMVVVESGHQDSIPFR